MFFKLCYTKVTGLNPLCLQRMLLGRIAMDMYAVGFSSATLYMSKKG